MSISAAPTTQKRSTILHSIANNSDALGELVKMLSDIEGRLYRPHPIDTGKPASAVEETLEAMIERQSDLIRELNETALQIMNRLA